MIIISMIEQVGITQHIYVPVTCITCKFVSIKVNVTFTKY